MLGMPPRAMTPQFSNSNGGMTRSFSTIHGRSRTTKPRPARQSISFPATILERRLSRGRRTVLLRRFLLKSCLTGKNHVATSKYKMQLVKSTRLWIVNILALLFTGIFVGCSTTNGTSFAQLDSVQPDEALVYFYRSGNETWVKSQKFDIYINREKIGTLPYGCYFSRVVRPGKILINSNPSGTLLPFVVPYLVEKAAKKPGQVEVDLKAGDIIFIELQAANKFTYIVGNLSVEEKQTAVNGMQNAKLVP
jgi:hypothetical protein